MIEVTNISKKFYGNTVLRGVTCCFQQGLTTAIVGENGSGKSTLLHIISGAYKPDSGEIVYSNGKQRINLIHRSPEYRHRLGIIRSFQEPRSYGSMTVRAVLTAGMLDHSSGCLFYKGFLKVPRVRFEKPMLGALESVNLLDKVDAPMRELSFGQRKLLDLAGLILSNAKVWLLDEPFAGVDSTSAQVIKSCIEERKSRISHTIIMVAHEHDIVAQISDLTVWMESGKIVGSEQPRQENLTT